MRRLTYMAELRSSDLGLVTSNCSIFSRQTGSYLTSSLTRGLNLVLPSRKKDIPVAALALVFRYKAHPRSSSLSLVIKIRPKSTPAFLSLISDVVLSTKGITR